MDPGTRVRCRLAARVLVLAGVVTMLVAGALTDTASASSRSSSTAPSGFRLLYETPSLSAPGALLGLAFTRTGPALAPHATIRLTLYSRLTTRSALTTAIGGGGAGPAVSSTPALPVSCLRAGPNLRVAVAVSPDGVSLGSRQLCGRAAPVLRLGCSGGCDGVYPLRVSVVGGGVTDSIVTLVTFATTSSTPLRVAWVLRVAGQASALSVARGALRGVHAHPKVPVTIDVQGSVLADGAASGTGSLSIGLIRGIATTAADELIAEPYVPADLGALRASHLRTEVIRQFALNEVVLKSDGVAAVPARNVTYGTGPQTPTMANAMATVGIRNLIVDGTSLGTDPATTLTWGDAFKATDAPSGPAILASDSELSALSADTASDPGLTAAQLLGELSFLHFEQPNLLQPRVAVMVTTATALVTSSLVNDVLEGLSHSPVLQPVSVTEAFHAVPVGANGFPPVRSFILGPSKPLPKATIGELEHLRIVTDALSSAVVGGSTPIPSIEGELLSAEEPLTDQQRTRLMSNVQLRLQDELGYFRIYDGPITLTESGASLPITVFSTAPYTVTATLVLKSPRITFPGLVRSRVPGFLLDASVRTTRVPARALVNGDLPLVVELVSPDGRLVLARAEITVRATGFSYVGVVLTALAALVLAAWWIRTSRRRRAARA